MSQDQDGPVRHLILCRFQPGTTPDQVEAFIERFRAVTRAVPGIITFENGGNNSREGLNRGLTHAAMLTFQDTQARDNYLPHPDHRLFLAEMGHLIAEILVFDYVPQVII